VPGGHPQENDDSSTVQEGHSVSATMMLDHPAWLTAEDGRARRAFRTGDSVWSVVCTPRESTGHTVNLACVIGDEAAAPVIDVIDPSTLTAPDEVGEPLRADGPIGRVRNPDLWDALATSIVRQVIRAGQARKLYRAFCQTHGAKIETAAGSAWLFPSPETVLTISDDGFAHLGMAFKRRPLCAAAEAYLQHSKEWADLSSARLSAELQTVPRIGPWTAGATVADVTNDYSLYPFADLAVRTWATNLAPALAWPTDEPAFAESWQRLAGDQLSMWTLLTLAWGVRHANRVAV
jgi:DNA-3-methyladenine glycosylase II